MSNATVVNVEGHWVLQWPDGGRRAVPCTRDVLEQIVADHNEMRAVSAALAAALNVFGHHDRVALSHGSHDKCATCFDNWPCAARKALDAYAETKATG